MPLGVEPSQQISIHALREEGDATVLGSFWSAIDFYPRPPRGGRPADAWEVRECFPISIHALREEGDDALVSCHTIPPNEQVLKVLYSVFYGVYALKRQLSDSTFSIFFQKFSRGADAPFGFFEESLLFSAHFRGLE